MRYQRSLLAASAAALVLAVTAPAFAQQQQWFVPNGGGGGAAGGHPPAPRPAPRPPVVRPSQPLAAPQTLTPQPAQPDQQQAATPAPQATLPPMPALPPVPKGVEPPSPRIGVLGVPEVMRASTAAQEVERTLGERRQKLNEDAQKEQNIWRELQQQLAAQRGSLSPEQIRAKEQELQNRVTNAQRDFRNRDRIIQEAAQYSLAQIERVLVAVIRQVAESRGMNLVLHRQQVALNVNEFDLTDEVTAQLNKVLPSVEIPPDNVSPATLHPAPAASGTPAPGAAPAAAAVPAPAAPAPAAPAPAAPAPAPAPATPAH